jgi:hypothetical protein
MKFVSRLRNRLSHSDDFAHIVSMEASLVASASEISDGDLHSPVVVAALEG